jgi:hypothetical protein
MQLPHLRILMIGHSRHQIPTTNLPFDIQPVLAVDILTHKVVTPVLELPQLPTQV